MHNFGISVIWGFLFVLKFIDFFVTSCCQVWEKLRCKSDLHSFYCFCAWMWSIFFISVSTIVWVIDSAWLYWGIPRIVVMLGKNYSKLWQFFIVIHNIFILSSTRVIFSLEITLFNKSFTTLRVITYVFLIKILKIFS